MNIADLFSPSFETARGAATLGVNVLVQSSLIITAGLLAARLLRSHGAAVQAVVLRVTLVAVMACPLASWLLAAAGISGFGIVLPVAETLAVHSPTEVELSVGAPAVVQDDPGEFISIDSSAAEYESPQLHGSGISFPHAQPFMSAESVPYPKPAAAELDRAPDQSARASRLRAEPGSDFAPRYPVVARVYGVVGSTWLCVAILLITRILLACVVVLHGRVRAAAADAKIVSLCESLSDAIGIRTPAIRVSPRIHSPCLVGLFRPAILLPSTMNSIKRDVLVHELAHLQRHDCLWQLLSRLMCAALWFQPLSWWLSRRLEQTADDVADDFVVQFGSDRADYARQLVDIAERYQPEWSAACVGAGIASFKSSLAKRVVRILDTSRAVSTRTGLTALVFIVLLGAAGTLAVGLLGAGTVEAKPEEPSNASEQREQKSTTADAPNEVVCAGRVLDREIRPVAGAKVYLTYYSKEPGPPLVRATTDSDGRFEFVVDRESLGTVAADAQIVAVADGYGLDWQQLFDDANQTRALELRLVPDVPIEGRIIDIEGNPVAAATVEVQSLRTTPDENLDGLLGAWERDRESHLRLNARDQLVTKQLMWLPFVGLPSIKTDADGRFRLTGLGKDRWLNLAVTGPGIGRSFCTILARPPNEIQSLVKDGSFAPTYGTQFEHAVSPGREIIGSVRERGTGKPIADAYVYCGGSEGTTDAEGNYRLEGVAKAEGYWVGAKTDSHFSSGLRAKDPPGLDPITVDLELDRGIAIHIRLRDKSTGQPIRGDFAYYGAIGNENVAGTEFANQPYAGTRGGTEPDGSGTMVVFPGPGYLCVRASEDVYLPDYPEVAGNAGPFHQIRAIPNPFEVGIFHSVVEINPEEGKPDTCELELELDPGGTCVGRVTGPDGQELDDVIFAGKTAIRPWSGPGYETLPSPNFEVLGMNPGVPRTALFMQRDRKLAKAIDVTAGSGPVNVSLEAVGAVAGRVVDADGNPRSNVTVRLQIRGHESLGGYAISKPPLGSLAHTLFGDNEIREQVLHPSAEIDAEGKFRIDGLIPGATYDVYAQSGKELGQLATDVKCVPGRTEDIGSLQIRAIERPSPRASARTAHAGTAVAAAEPKRASLPALENENVTYSGHVLDPDGKPMAGAKLYVVGSLKDEMKDRPRATSDDSGRFEFSIAKSHFSKEHGEEPWEWSSVVAVAEGFGPGVNIRPPGETLELRLANADFPISGRIVDLQGQPVAGVRVRFNSLKVPIPDKGGVKAWRSAIESRDEGMEMERRFFTMAMLPTFLRKQETLTGADGQFSLASIGRDRIVSLIIDGPTIESQEINIITRDGIASISVPWYPDAPTLGKLHYYSAGSDHVAGPTRPVVGMVRDKETGEPLSGFEVSARGVGNPIRPVQTTTDEKGRFRLTGLAVDKEQSLTVSAPDDQAYVDILREVDVRLDDEPLTVDFDVPRGVWAEGRVVDKRSGKPARARLSYFAFLTNEAYGSLVNSNLARGNLDIYTKEDGTFRVVVLPGRGIFAARGAHDRYLFGTGADQIDGPKDNTFFRTAPYLCSAGNFHTLVEVNPAKDDGQVDVTVELDTGETATGLILDPDGNALPGTEIRGMFAMSYWRESKTADFEVTGLSPSRSRQLLFWHEERSLAGRQLIAPNAEQVTIHLQPAGTLIGRLLDRDGAPWPDAKLRSTALNYDRASDTEHDFVVLPQSIELRTDSEGRFRIPGLVPGLKYSFSVDQGRRLSPNFLIDVSVQPGEMKNVGDVRPTPNAQAGKGREEMKSTTAVPAAATNQQRITGVVLGPDGKPFAGASVFVGLGVRDGDDNGIRVADSIEGKSGTDGRFEISYRERDLFENPEAVPKMMWERLSSAVYVVATAPGFGPGWIRGSTAAETELRLVPDAAIEGQLVSLEGAPVANARVRLDTIQSAPDNNVQPWLDALRAGTSMWKASVDHQHQNIVAGVFGMAEHYTTDEGGRFRIPGVGRDRIVRLIVEGPSVARTVFRVVARDTEPLPTNLPSFEMDGDQVYGAPFKRIVPPSQPIVGILRDAESGEPLVGVTVESYKFAGSNLMGGRTNLLQTSTDAKGRFRLEGMPKGSGNRLLAVPHDDQPYFMREIPIPEMAGLDPIEVEAELHRGIWITGKVVDKATREPVMASLKYLPFLSNEYAEKLPEFTIGNGEVEGGLGNQHRYMTAPDGSFRLVGLPGRAIVGAETLSKHRVGAGSEKIDGMDGEGRFSTYINPLRASRIWPNVMVEIDPAPDADSVSITLEADPGSDVKISVTDADGKPIIGYRASGQMSSSGWGVSIEDPSFLVTGLAPAETRVVLLDHVERRLGKAIRITNEGGDVTVKLEPLATVRGRLIDTDGDPVSRATLLAFTLPSEDFNPSLQPITTDDQGLFEFAAVPVGSEFSVQVRLLEGSTRTNVIKFAPRAGETVSLGDIVLESRRRTTTARNDAATMRTVTVAGNDSPVAPTPNSATTAQPERLIRGRVLDPNG